MLEKSIRTSRVLEAIETVQALAHQLTGLGNIVQLLRQFQYASFSLMIFCSVVMVLTPFVKRGLYRTIRSSPSTYSFAHPLQRSMRSLDSIEPFVAASELTPEEAYCTIVVTS
jgi:hypothetical protein